MQTGCPENVYPMFFNGKMLHSQSGQTRNIQTEFVGPKFECCHIGSNSGILVY